MQYSARNTGRDVRSQKKESARRAILMCWLAVRDRGMGRTVYRTNLVGLWLTFRFTLEPRRTPIVVTAGCFLKLSIRQLCRSRNYQMRGAGVVLVDDHIEITGYLNAECFLQSRSRIGYQPPPKVRVFVGSCQQLFH